MSISGCIISQSQQKGTAGPGRTLETKVPSDFNPEETLAPRPQVASPCLGSNDNVSSTPTSQDHSLILTPRTQEDKETCNYVSTMPSARKPDPPSRRGRP